MSAYNNKDIFLKIDGKQEVVYKCNAAMVDFHTSVLIYYARFRFVGI